MIEIINLFKLKLDDESIIVLLEYIESNMIFIYNHGDNGKDKLIALISIIYLNVVIEYLHIRKS